MLLKILRVEWLIFINNLDLCKVGVVFKYFENCVLNEGVYVISSSLRFYIGDVGFFVYYWLKFWCYI